jgi:hypothetical protein
VIGLKWRGGVDGRRFIISSAEWKVIEMEVWCFDTYSWRP